MKLVPWCCVYCAEIKKTTFCNLSRNPKRMTALKDLCCILRASLAISSHAYFPHLLISLHIQLWVIFQSLKSATAALHSWIIAFLLTFSHPFNPKHPFSPSFSCSMTIWSAWMGRRSGVWLSLHGRGGVSKLWSSMRRCLSSTWTPVPGTWPSTTMVGRERQFPSAQTSWVRQSQLLLLGWSAGERWRREGQVGSWNEIEHQH